jgi:predicted TIM-barrel fold metal-dependent hydrolase
MLCDGNAKLRAIVAEISNHLIFGNDYIAENWEVWSRKVNVDE